jgi:hypothetical protein
VKRLIALLAALVLSLFLFAAAPGTAVAQTRNTAAAGTTLTPRGAENCGGIFHPCGIVNNRTSRYLQVARDSTSHTGCNVPPESPEHPRGWLAPGRNSNQAPLNYKDTDCFRSTECSVFYLRWHRPNEWVRIYSSVFVYSLNC